MRKSHRPASREATLAIDRATTVAWVQASVRAFARANGLSTRDEWSLAVAASEAATNIIKFATTGVITVRIVASPPLLELVADDDGPGVSDVARALVDGVSEGVVLAETESRAGRRGLGTGLGAIARVMGELTIDRSPRGGARITARRPLR